MIDMEIWAGDLGAYNAGELVGDWVNLAHCVDLDDLRDKVAEVTNNADEFHICDYEGPFPVERYDPLEKVWEMAQIIGDCVDPDAMAAYLSYQGWDLSGAHRFEDAYCGDADSLEDYALNYFEQVYADTVHIPGFIIEVDTAAWEMDHFTMPSSSGGVHVFRYV